MKNKFKKSVFLLSSLMMLSVGAGIISGVDSHIDTAEAAVQTATLSFADKAQRTSFSTTKQVWEQNGVTFTNNKAGSSSNVADYANPVRLYAGFEIVVSYTSNISKIEFTASSSSYATALKNSIGDSATASGSVVTIYVAESDTFTISKLTAQVRLSSLTVSSDDSTSGGEGGESTTKTYLVTFNYDRNGTSNVTEEVEENNTVTKPEDPTKDGFTFGGWYTDEDCTLEYDFDLSVTDDLILYAKWNPVVDTTGWVEKTDTLNRALTGITKNTNSYGTWSDKTSITTAVYAGNSAGGNDSIQLRSNNNNSGIITTTSGGYAKNVSVTWNSSTSNDRTLNVYGKNTAYTSAEELYDKSSQGTLLGTIVYGTSTELAIDEYYQYIGMRSNSGAMYLSEVSITWLVDPSTVEETHIVSFVTNCDIVLDDVEIKDGGVVSEPTGLSKTDYTFEGWYTDSEFNNKYDFSTPVTGDLTLYANWTEIVKIPEPSAIESTVEALADNAPTDYSLKQSYIVEGVWTCSDSDKGSGTLTSNEKSISIYYLGKDKADVLLWDDIEGTYTYSKPSTYNSIGLVDGDTIKVAVVYSSQYSNYYAYFIEKLAGEETYTITFNAGEKGTASETSKITTGEFTFPSVTVNSAYYQFSGWYLESNTENLYSAGNSYTAESDLTFIAKYETVTPKSYVYELVTDASTLVAGDKLIIAANVDNNALSTNQKSNNRGATEIKRIDNMLSVNFIDNDIEILTLEAGTVDGTFAFNTGSGYLFAASSSSNYLRTEETMSANSSWEITITEGVASIIAQGSNSNNILKYNATSDLFSCYGDGNTQKDVQIYKISEKSLSINFMYNDDENPEAIRFISTIAGFDASEIESVQYSFVKDGVTATPEAEKCIYSSIKNMDAFGEKANTYYAVYAINGVQGVLNQSFNATITVTLTNGLVLSVTSTTFNLGSY